MTDENGEDRVEVRLPAGLPLNAGTPNGVQVRGLSWDQQGVDQAETPSGLVAGSGERGVETEWDAGTLDSAITWLETHASYLWRLSHNMVEIKDTLGGDTGAGGQNSPFGSFDGARELAQRHSGLYTSTERNLRTLSDDLYSAADALREVKRNYEDAEGANAVTAQEMTRMLNSAASGDAS
ncbi:MULTISPECIES: hypothetical protein [Micromonospora]|uniref:PE domain-containing protein n=1 Tax=Micromonospora rosaria TaxID=47874 RepID=A0A136PJY9_9ACTN|nr:hypothetical protein [Micromonospora rosaria]KXK58742.1 hypothetical protein AWW66_28030 [Micromonospora rosaria]